MRKSVQTELDELFAHLQQQAQLVRQVSEQPSPRRVPNWPATPSSRSTTGCNSVSPKPVAGGLAWS